jgi:hypothetical protein
MLYPMANLIHIMAEGTVVRIRVLPAGHLQISYRSRPVKLENMGINLDHNGQSGQQRSAIYQPVSLLFGGGCWLYSVAFSPAHFAYTAYLDCFVGQNCRRNGSTKPLV